MKPCAMAGRQCPREATVTVRIAGVGDRSVCAEDLAVMQRLGMDVRVLEPNAFVPEWRTRLAAKDLTGLVLG